jgi:glycerol-3-phosphate dehydrogenase
MPIVEQVYMVVHEGKEAGRAVHDLMNRALKAEFRG